MATSATPQITPEEYLERERKAQFKSEFLRGRITAMAGTSIPHGRIVTNLGRELSQALLDGPCNVYTTDIRLCVNPAGLYTYPDVMVTCGEEKYADAHVDTLMNPVLLVEVLSDSTKNYDRGQKFETYREIPSLLDYLTIAQEGVRVEHWMRQADRHWLLKEYFNLEETMALPSIGVSLPLSRIYLKVDLAAKVDLARTAG